MEIVLLSAPGDCVKIALRNTFERSRKTRDFTIATSGRSKSVRETIVVIGIYAIKSFLDDRRFLFPDSKALSIFTPTLPITPT